MKVGDLVFNGYYGKGMIVKQQGVVDRWYVRWFKPISSVGGDKNVHAVWESELEVISESR